VDRDPCREHQHEGQREEGEAAEAEMAHEPFDTRSGALSTIDSLPGEGGHSLGALVRQPPATWPAGRSGQTPSVTLV
jgi:hypothetical protein